MSRANPEERTLSALPVILAVLSGLLAVAALPKPDVYPLAWICLAPLLLALRYASGWRARVLLGHAFGFVFFAGTCYWIRDTMVIHGGLGPLLAFAIYVLFSFAYGLYGALFGLAMHAVLRRFADAGLLVAPFLWVGVEWLRAHLFTGFPWMLIGYAAVPYSGLLQIVSVTGVYGLSFLIVLMNALLALGFWRHNRMMVVPAAAAIVVAGWIPAPPDTLSDDRSFPVRIVQANIPIDFPWGGPEASRLLGELTGLSHEGKFAAASGPALIVWPENPAPFYLVEDRSLQQIVRTITTSARSHLLMGYLDEIDGRATNSAALIDPAGRVVSRYDKTHLVPFGEYVPGWLSGIVGKMTRQVGDFGTGGEYTVSTLGDGSIATVICYESIFPHLVRQFPLRGAEVLAVITNDGWFGGSSAPYQHLRMAVARAVENRRYILRSANTGISAIIDPRGNVLQRTPLGERTTIDGVAGFRSDLTFYTRYGDVFAGACSLLALCVLAATRFRTRG